MSALTQRDLIDALLRQASELEDEAADRDAGTEENNARVASYLRDQATIIRRRADDLDHGFQQLAQVHGYQY